MVRPPITPLPFPHPLPSPHPVLKFTHLHCPDQCQPAHSRLRRTYMYRTVDQLRAAMYHRAGAVLRDVLHPEDQDTTLEVDAQAVRLYITYKNKNNSGQTYSLGDMADKKKRDQVMADKKKRDQVMADKKKRDQVMADKKKRDQVMADKKKRDQVMAELGKGGENMMLEVKFTTRVKDKKKANKAPEPPTEVVWDNQKGKGKAME